jgi:hypothetical protein
VQLRMEERGGAPLLVNRAEHRSSSASPPGPSSHDEPLRTGDGSIAKGASSTTASRCVFVCCIEMAGAVIMWSIPLFRSRTTGRHPVPGRWFINPPTPMRRSSNTGNEITVLT